MMSKITSLGSYKYEKQASAAPIKMTNHWLVNYLFLQYYGLNLEAQVGAWILIFSSFFLFEIGFL